MVHRTGAGYYRIDRRIPGLGRLALSVRSKNVKQVERVNRAIDRCLEDGRLGVLQALKDGRLSITELLSADRQNEWHQVEAGAVSRRPFIALATKAIAELRCDQATRDYYAEGIASLERRGIITKDTTVGQLVEVDWDTAARDWNASDGAWRKARAAISRLLSVLFGKKHAAGRVAVTALIPNKPYRPRVPSLTVEQFWEVCHTLEEPVQAILVSLVGTGMRPGELWGVTRDDLRPSVPGVQVRGTKTAGSHRFLELDPGIYAWLDRAVPVKLEDRFVRETWQAACRAKDVTPTTLHDLRHCFGQWTLDAGVSDADVQMALGHVTGFMTRLYRQRHQTGVASKGMAEILVPQEITQVKTEESREAV